MKHTARAIHYTFYVLIYTCVICVFLEVILNTRPPKGIWHPSKPQVPSDHLRRVRDATREVAAAVRELRAPFLTDARHRQAVEGRGDRPSQSVVLRVRWQAQSEQSEQVRTGPGGQSENSPENTAVRAHTRLFTRSRGGVRRPEPRPTACQAPKVPSKSARRRWRSYEQCATHGTRVTRRPKGRRAC